MAGVLLFEEMALQCLRRDAGLGQRVRRARRGCESLDAIPVTFGAVSNRQQRRGLSRTRDAFEGDDPIAARENLFDGGLLGVAEMRIGPFDLVSGDPADEGRV